MRYALAILLLFLSAPAFAAGNLTVSGSSMPPYFINTNYSQPILNLTLNSSVNTVNISSISVTMVGAGASYVYSVELRDSSGALLGINYSIDAATNKTAITFAAPIEVNTSFNRTFIVAASLLGNATLLSTIAANISGAGDVGVDAQSNVSIIGGTIQSNDYQIQDVHANATMSPLFVDTAIVNQSLVYRLVQFGRNTFSNISITVPSEYKLVAVTEVKQGSSTLYNSTFSQVSVSLNASSGVIIVTNSANFSTSGDVIVNISVNASASPVTAKAFNSTIGGSNITGALPYVSGSNTSVTTQQLLNITSVYATKATAISNGTDFWEFSMNVNLTTNIPGIIQFKMDNWTNNQSQTIGLWNADQTSYYATLRDNANSSRAVNVTNSYAQGDGIALQSCCSSSSAYTLVLRMVIPSGTPSAASWFTTYRALFRAS